MRALISVYNKTGAVEFAKALSELGCAVISTGGTYSMLKEADVANLMTVEDVTKFPEMLGGRVKTLHPALHGGILAVRGGSHMEEIKDHGIEPIDIVVCNLYPFKETLLSGAGMKEIVENIDIGGPSMLRAAAKNFEGVAAVCDPADYPIILDELSRNGSVSRETRLRLAAKVFSHVAFYDSLVAKYLRQEAGVEFPRELALGFQLKLPLSYGENPHQKAAFYEEPGAEGVASAEQLHGKALSYNNITDGSAAVRLLNEFSAPAAVALKHANPCGVGCAGTLPEAFAKALEADPVSIYGGIVAFNREVCAATAKMLKPILLDMVIAPSYTPEALAVLRAKKNTRVLAMPNMLEAGSVDFRRVAGGVCVQERNGVLFPDGLTVRELQVVTRRRPSESEYDDLAFSWAIVKHVTSNAIVIGKNGQSLGIGSGQVNRVRAVRQSIDHAGESVGLEAVTGAALASDAYFPFGDSVEAAGKAGVTAIIQPGGSIRDQESIEACDRLGIAMVFTGMRHFRH